METTKVVVQENLKRNFRAEAIGQAIHAAGLASRLGDVSIRELGEIAGILPACHRTKGCQMPSVAEVSGIIQAHKFVGDEWGPYPLHPAPGAALAALNSALLCIGLDPDGEFRLGPSHPVTAAEAARL